MLRACLLTYGRHRTYLTMGRSAGVLTVVGLNGREIAPHQLRSQLMADTDRCLIGQHPKRFLVYPLAVYVRVCDNSTIRTGNSQKRWWTAARL
jgi:hypothetical protein